MDPFGYLSILTSIVLGLGITRVLSGCGRLMQVRHHAHLYWIHFLWALNLFLYMVLNWWILYRWHTATEWSFFIFLFVLLSPTITFIMSVLLFPEPIEEGADLTRHFYANHRSFFLLAATIAPIDALDTLLKGWDHFAAQGIVYPVTLLLLTTLNVIAAFTKSERYHSIFAGFFLIYLAAFIGINLRVLG